MMKKILLILATGIMVSCAQEQKTETATDATTDVDPKFKKIEVIDVIPGGGYTYVQALQDADTIWMAMGQADIKKGGTYYFEVAMPMKNFKSKELDRTFETIYFLDGLLDNPRDPLPGETHTKAASGPNADIAFEAEEGIISIADLYADRANYKGKTVSVRGQVTKVNNEILDRNWVHIQDGTGTDDNFDLTITTEESVKVGDIVRFTGTVAVDKDFTLGYKYELLLEDATLPDSKM